MEFGLDRMDVSPLGDTQRRSRKDTQIQKKERPNRTPDDKVMASGSFGLRFGFLMWRILLLVLSSPARSVPKSHIDLGILLDQEYKELVDQHESHVLVDVRPAHHYKIAAVPGSVNIPLSILEDKLSTIDLDLEEARQVSGTLASLYVVCRRGNDSQRAVQYLNSNGFPLAMDIIGGLESWAQDADRTFPIY